MDAASGRITLIPAGTAVANRGAYALVQLGRNGTGMGNDVDIAGLIALDDLGEDLLAPDRVL